MSYCLACGAEIDLEMLAGYSASPAWGWECDECGRLFEITIENQTRLMNGDGRQTESVGGDD